MKQSIANIFLPLCGFSLIFSVDSTIQGLIAAFGLLIFYPPLAVSCYAAKKILRLERAYTLMLFVSVLLMGLYLNFLGGFDAETIKPLLFKAPASMAAGPFLMLGFIRHPNNSSAEREHRMISEGIILALMVAGFSLFRDILANQSIDLRFANWGSVVPLALPAITAPVRSAGFVLMALFLSFLSFFEDSPHA